MQRSTSAILRRLQSQAAEDTRLALAQAPSPPTTRFTQTNVLNRLRRQLAAAPSPPPPPPRPPPRPPLRPPLRPPPPTAVLQAAYAALVARQRQRDLALRRRLNNLQRQRQRLQRR